MVGTTRRRFLVGASFLVLIRVAPSLSETYSAIQDGPFGGDPNAVFSAIDTSGGIAMSRTSGQTPAFVHVSAANIKATGQVLDATGNPMAPESQPALRPYERLEYTWNFGDPLGTEIFTDPVTKNRVNANKDQSGPEAVYCYRTAGIKTITLNIRGKASGGGYITASVTTTFTVRAFNASGGTFYYDSRNNSGTENGTAAHPYRTLRHGPINASGRVTIPNVRIMLAYGSSWDNSSYSTLPTLAINVNGPIRVEGWINPSNPSSDKPKLLCNASVGNGGSAIANQGPGVGNTDIVFSHIHCEVQSAPGGGTTVGLGLNQVNSVNLAGIVEAQMIAAANGVAVTFPGGTSIASAAHPFVAYQMVTFSGENLPPEINPTAIYFVSPTHLEADAFSISSTSSSRTLVSTSAGNGLATSKAVISCTPGRLRGGADEFFRAAAGWHIYDNAALGPGNGAVINSSGLPAGAYANLGDDGGIFNIDGYSGGAIATEYMAFVVPNSVQAVFTGSISTSGGTSILTILGATVEGRIAKGQRIVDLTGRLAYGTQILSNRSGSGVGSTWYVTTQPEKVSTELMISSGPYVQMKDIYFDNLDMVNNAGGIIWNYYNGGTSIFTTVADVSGCSLYGCTCIREAGPTIPLTFGARRWNSMLGVTLNGTGPGGVLLHYINPEDSQTNFLYRWLNVATGGKTNSGFNFCLHPRAQNYNNWTVPGDYIGGNICVSDCQFQYATNGIGLNNEHNAVGGWYGTYSNAVIQRTRIGYVTQTALFASSCQNITMRDCQVWQVSGLFSPPDGPADNISALNHVGSYCFYRNLIYRPRTVPTYGGAGNELGSLPVLRLFPTNASSTFQELSDNIIRDDRSGNPPILSMKFSDQLANHSIFTRNQFYTPNATNHSGVTWYIGNNNTFGPLSAFQAAGNEPNAACIVAGCYANPNWPSPQTGYFK